MHAFFSCFGFRKVHQNLEDGKKGFSRPSLLKTLSILMGAGLAQGGAIIT